MMENAIIGSLVNSIIHIEGILSNPLSNYILWHLLLLAGTLVVFLDARRGFPKTIGFIACLFSGFKRNSQKNAMTIVTSKYRERSQKINYSSAFFTVTITILVALMIYSRLIFFSIIISDSMNPTLKKGDLILMQNIIVKPEIGDIVTYNVQNKQLPITHRIVSISGKELVTKGDSNPSEDSWRATKEDIIGKNVYFMGKPVVIEKVGNYFIADATRDGKIYGPEFNALSRMIQWAKAVGVIIFIMCMALYLAISIRDVRKMKL
ncbi:MAG TPA: signal peptidase I [Candidatus Methanoperedens sp.]